MTTKVIFNTDKRLKEAAMRKAHAKGITLSAFLNMATQAFVDERLTVGIFERDLARARDDVRAKRVHSHADTARILGL